MSAAIPWPTRLLLIRALPRTWHRGRPQTIHRRCGAAERGDPTSRESIEGKEFLHLFHVAIGRSQEDGAGAAQVVEAQPLEQAGKYAVSILIVGSDPVTAARLGPMADNPGSLRRFLKTVIRPAIYGRCTPLEVSAHHLHGEPIPAIEAVRRPFTPFEVGDAWGGTWGTTWFRFRGSIPNSWAGAEVVALIHLGGDQMVGFTAEGQIWDTGLRPVQGLHHQHREFVLTPEAHGGPASRVLRRGGRESDPAVAPGRLAPAPARLLGCTALYPRDSRAGGRRSVRRRTLSGHADPGGTGRTRPRPN